VLGGVPFAQDWRVYGRLGIASVKVKANANVAGSGISDTHMGSVVGLGLHYAIDPNFGIRLEANRYAGNSIGSYDTGANTKYRTIGIGLDYRF
jgi:opacity protein-like surface antigen